uniref:DNA replication complex GINS protein PSF2 N-terminal domain-containing protein n=1 Tax=Cucumis sativus TaxID=3659 RepID=A0A0A0KVY8_CUCSA
MVARWWRRLEERKRERRIANEGVVADVLGLLKSHLVPHNEIVDACELPSPSTSQLPLPLTPTTSVEAFVEMAGQSDPHLNLFSAEEVEFVAEDEMVEIIPNMRMDSLHLICGDYGPFYPQIATEVPLWLAIALKKRGKCAIRTPEWMSVGKFCLLNRLKLLFCVS